MDQESRQLEAPGGRRLAFTVAGPPEGDLVIFHTGTPGSSFLYVGMIRECAARGLRVACIDRPGYGGSDRVPGRSYADSPADTAIVADALGAESFYSIGHSGGGGPALADAALLPDRVRAVAISATLAPRLRMGADWRVGLEEANGEELAAMEAGEPVLRKLLEGWAERARQVRTGEDITENPDFSGLYAPADLACFEGEFLEFALKTYSLMVTPGVDGWIDDDFAFFGDWGFDLSHISAPAAIWHGKEDRVIPEEHANWLAANVPGARLCLQPEEGHISLLKHRLGEMLDQLLEVA